jgi:hypothetical protein
MINKLLKISKINRTFCDDTIAETYLSNQNPAK